MEDNMLADFKFNLQLFADGDMVQPEPVSAEPGTDTNQGMEFNYALDDNGNLIINDNYVPPTTEPVKVANYTPEEMASLNWETDKLDPNRIPPEMQAWYKSMQAGFTRGTQSLAEKQRQLDAAMAELQAQRELQVPVQNQQYRQPEPQPIVPQASPEEQKMAYYAELQNYGEKTVERITGVPYDEFNKQHQVIMADAIADAKAQVVQANQYQVNLNATMAKYTSDPEWGNVYKFADEKLRTMPTYQGMEALQRIQNGDLAFIDSFLGSAKEEYYANKLAPQERADKVAELLEKAKQYGKVQPPIVESGNTFQQETSTAQQFDGKAFGRMTNQQQVEYMKQFKII